jgi:phosphoribosylformylglycinamidine synthase
MAERSLQQAVLALIQKDMVASAHDCAEGGLAVALVESALGDGEHPMGLDVTLEDALPAVPLLFGEAQGRVVVSCAPDRVDDVLERALRYGVPARHVGTVKKAAEGVRIAGGGHEVRAEVAALLAAWRDGLPARMDAGADAGGAGGAG